MPNTISFRSSISPVSMSRFTAIFRDLRNAVIVGLVSAVVFVGVTAYLTRSQPPKSIELPAFQGPGVPVLCYHYLRADVRSMASRRPCWLASVA